MPHSQTLFGNAFALETLFRFWGKQSLPGNGVSKFRFGNRSELIIYLRRIVPPTHQLTTPPPHQKKIISPPRRDRAANAS